jgi:hypothetical protein
MSDGEKALWLINRERIDRGLLLLQGLEENVTGVAQYYAEYLLDNNQFSHTADGKTPWQRLDANPAIGVCRDFLNVAENLAVFVTSGFSIPMPIERSVYNWMYVDANSTWGHRHAILWYPYTDNSGTVGMEGFLGIGRANGGPYKGPFSSPWPFAEIIVMNVFDPCTTWGQTIPAVTTTSISLITQISASSGGNVTSDGGANVTERGVCWSTLPNPTTANSKTPTGSGTGSFTGSITGLSANTAYYVRAYAVNSAGTAYGNQIRFITEDTNGNIPGDIDGDKSVTLKDAMAGLQILAAMSPSGVKIADVNGDGRIGLPEVNYILNYVSQ